MLSDKYLGFINVTHVLGLKSSSPIDFLILENKLKGSIVFYSQDTLFLLSQGSLK